MKLGVFISLLASVGIVVFLAMPATDFPRTDHLAAAAGDSRCLELRWRDANRDTLLPANVRLESEPLDSMGGVPVVFRAVRVDRESERQPYWIPVTSDSFDLVLPGRLVVRVPVNSDSAIARAGRPVWQGNALDVVSARTSVIVIQRRCVDRSSVGAV